MNIDATDQQQEIFYMYKYVIKVHQTFQFSSLQLHLYQLTLLEDHTLIDQVLLLVSIDQVVIIPKFLHLYQ